MTTEEVKAKRQRHQDRVTLDQECLGRVDGWIEQVTSVAKGVTLSRKDAVNWIVRQHGDTLSSNELTDLKARYFSEVRFLQQAIAALKAAKQGGEPITLDQILANASHQPTPLASKRRRARKTQKTGTPEEAAPSNNVDDAEMIHVLE